MLLRVVLDRDLKLFFLIFEANISNHWVEIFKFSFTTLIQIHAVRLREDGVHVLRAGQVAAQAVQQDAPRLVSD